MKALILSQQELLKYEGHYGGPVDGNWSPRCAAAMRSFTGTVKAHPSRMRTTPFMTTDTIPETWRWVGSGVDLRLIRRDRPDTRYVVLDETTATKPTASVETLHVEAAEDVSLSAVAGLFDAQQDSVTAGADDVVVADEASAEEDNSDSVSAGDAQAVKPKSLKRR